MSLRLIDLTLDIAYYDFPSNKLFLTLHHPYCYSFVLGSSFISSLITTFRFLYPIGKPYASYYVLLV